MSNWIETLAEKKRQLSLIASWASIAQMGVVRDYCRKAEYELKLEIARLREMDKRKEPPNA